MCSSHPQLQLKIAEAGTSTLPQSSSTMSVTLLSPSLIMPSRRPKLSLETSRLPIHFGRKSTTGVVVGTECETPTTIRNTYANTFNAIPQSSHPLPELNDSTQQSKPPSSPLPPVEVSASSSCSSETSPFSTSIPYSISIGTHSILRNSPLPRRLVSASSNKPKPMFPTAKRVAFHDKLVQLMPMPLLEDPETSDSDSYASNRTWSYDSSARVAEMQLSDEDEREETPVTPVQGRKRRRDWVWTLGSLESEKTRRDGKDGMEGLVLEHNMPEAKTLDHNPSDYSNQLSHPLQLDREIEDAPLEYIITSDKPDLPNTSTFLQPRSMIQPIMCDDG